MPLRKTTQPSRVTLGDNGKYGKRNIVSVALNKSDLRTPATASITAISAAVTGSNSASVTTPLYVELPAPRSITVTAGGTAASIAATPVVVNGLNVEGKPISESLTPTAGTAGTLTGTKAFAVVTGFTIPTQGGAGATFSVGTGPNFGLSTRNLSVTQVKLYKQVVASGAQSLVNPGSTNFDAANVENNWVTLDVTASGLSRYRVYALNYNWHLNPVNDQPNYGV